MSHNFCIQVLTKDLSRAVGFAGGIIDKKPVKPILGHIKLEARNSRLYIKATSSDITLSVDIAAQIQEEGSTTVSILTFAEIVRKIPDTHIQLMCSRDPDEITIKCENFISNLATLPAEEFPSIENNITPEVSFTIEAQNLLRIINGAEFSMSTEETRYNLNGIFLNSSESNMLNATALDGHRLSTLSTKLDNIPFFGVILHKRTVGELLKILKDSSYTSGTLKVMLDSNRISFAAENIEILSKLVDATFPEYQAFIPTQTESALLIHSKPLMNIVDRVSTITQDQFRAIKLRMNKVEVEVSAFGETKGKAKELITNTEEDQKFVYEGVSLQIGFNPKYLLDILKNFDNEEIALYFHSSEDPILIQSVVNQHDKYVIMPMKV